MKEINVLTSLLIIDSTHKWEGAFSFS